MYRCPRLLKDGPTVLTLYLRIRSDLQERYEPYCADFGPVNLGVVYRFCEMMHVRLTDPRLATRHLVYYTDESPAVCSNTAFLLAAYMVCCHGWTAEEAVVPFAMIEPNPFKPFRDATYLPSDFPVTLLDCLMSLKKSIDLGWYRYGEV
jgi:cell division cycle 14